MECVNKLLSIFRSGVNPCSMLPMSRLCECDLVYYTDLIMPVLFYYWSDIDYQNWTLEKKDSFVFKSLYSHTHSIFNTDTETHKTHTHIIHKRPFLSLHIPGLSLSLHKTILVAISENLQLG